MPLTQEQVAELKQQLHKQIEHLSPAQKIQAAAQIDSMSAEALEAMLNQQVAGPKKTGEKQKTIFRSIVDGDIETVKVEENNYAIAVMDISPIAKGHVLIIPKKAVSDAKHLPVPAFTLAKNIGKRVSIEFKAKSTAIQTENKFGECVIHVIPSYDDKVLDLSSQRTQASKEDLELIARNIRPIQKKKRLPLIKKETKPVQEKSSLPSRQRRVP